MPSAFRRVFQLHDLLANYRQRISITDLDYILSAKAEYAEPLVRFLRTGQSTTLSLDELQDFVLREYIQTMPEWVEIEQDKASCSCEDNQAICSASPCTT